MANFFKSITNIYQKNMKRYTRNMAIYFQVISKMNEKYEGRPSPARPKPGAAHGPDRDRAAPGLARAGPNINKNPDR